MDKLDKLLTIILIFIVLMIILSFMFGLPEYSVWHQKKAGQAILAKANFSKQVAVQEAEAKNAAAEYLAQAEVTRAKGVAQANKIIGQSLNDNEAYLRYLYINNLENTKNQVIYIPTEASLPILEANRDK
jgi:regulator of protease activity HflC (stomatin/prohibitin superfamily)